ncbi:glycerol-3-phosphate 1-O-acyltransferase PlsY [Legionella taurinensis]|uniref:Glycerol-3-phosphate acyltransferase n=1 Tax=Legionella taurinensis TaxID=70611 RepID=A0A3A5LIJ4_9GAMM|nr:glycerol-3-phosphate 1-O-acyltransferase PlsY [Legionella taurinensis]RJT49088.1 glycerol-3-phosphate 1-O-acyltransferase [Legionella taurinensis]RJT67348.1 glycerol-3-phosphate 1-O-acyltransferase [Legionella taurinensis]STY27026.1 transmembrane protein [Legionella taurinensis]
MLSFFLFLFVVIVAYLCGSLCSAVIVSRLFSLPDPRMEGSKNPGATNVLRLSGKKYAIIVLIGDMLKGVLPVLLARLLDAGPVTMGFAAFAAVMGHMYPVFFQFRGGKGVATALGALLSLNLILGSLVIVTWLAIAHYTRYSSLASIVSIILAPLYAAMTMGNIEIIPPLFFITIFVLYQHRDNITRLIDGEEPKIRFKDKEHPTVTEEILSPPPGRVITEDDIEGEITAAELIAEQEKPASDLHQEAAEKRATSPKKPTRVSKAKQPAKAATTAKTATTETKNPKPRRNSPDKDSKKS